MTKAKGVRDGLMQGEDPTSEDPRDARHWISVYDQMIQFKRRLMGDSRAGLARLPAASRAELRPDIEIIEKQLLRYERRLEFWYERHVRLEGVFVDEETRTLSHRGRSVRLTGREHQLLKAFLAHPGEYLPARRLVADAWHDPGLSSDELRMYVGTLRQKLKAVELGGIVNKPSRGYCLQLDQP